MFENIENGRFGAILIDPPWRFANFSAKGTGRSAVSHYDVMALSALKELPVQEWAARDCALFMWVIDPMLKEAMELLEAWGFTYKTVAFYYAKTNKNRSQDADPERMFFMGPGYWTRANPEQCWLATRGRPARKGKGVRKLIVEPRREHSRKPDCTHERIETLVDGPYLEVFAREAREGWVCVGNQVNDDRKYTRRQPSKLRDGEDPASVVIDCLRRA